MAGQPNVRASGDRIEQLLDELQTAVVPRTFEKVEELVRVVTELYGTGLARIVELIDSSPEVMEAMTSDELVAALLLVHELHPEALRTRVESGLAKVRPLLGSHGGDVELLDLDPDAGAVLIRLLGSCQGCPSSAVTLQMAVEQAILAAAPEIRTIDVEDEPVQTPVLLVSKPAYDTCPSELAHP